MKKIFTKLGIILIASATILPLSACTFNFYINRATNSIAKSFADETSALIKSMVMSKELNADTSSTNDDIMAKITNNSIKNLTSNTSLSNWGDLRKKWGDNGFIKTEGFNPDLFFKATGTGKLTKNINSKKTINNVFSSLNYIRLIPILNNPSLADIVLNSGIDTISNFLKSLQGDLSKSGAGLQLLAKLIKNYDSNFLNPLTTVFGNLVDGSWSKTQTTTPKNEAELTKFMSNWKDNSGQPYSAWNDGNDWKIDPRALLFEIFPGHKVKDWNWNKDYDLYHGGTLINYLFWKISKDHKIPGAKKPDPRYLGAILSDHITLDGSVLDPDNIKVEFNQEEFLNDIKQYLGFLLTDPLYLLLLVEGIIPIIKKWILEMPDITQGVNNLTIGNGYPTNRSTNSYNLLDIVNTIKNLVNNPTKLKQVLQLIFGKTTEDNRGFDTFLYDVKLNLKLDKIPLTLTLGGLIGSGKYDPDPLIDTLINTINTDSVKSVINSIVDLITKIAQQYPGNAGINIDLKKLESFLFANDKGLLIILNSTIEELKNIINKNDVLPADIEKLYQTLGGNDETIPTFQPDSVIDVLQKTMVEPNSELNNILYLILGNTESEKLGIGDVISDNNNQWIKNNYENYFDADNATGMNKKIANTYNITMNKNISNNIQTINLKYDFTYQIKNTTYHFVITAIAIENIIDFQGIHTFKFKSIALIN